jgi:hypothetical protein
MTISPEDLQAARQVVHEVGEESDDMDFTAAIQLRRELQRLAATVKSSLSLVETEMLRQVEKNAKTVNGVTYARTANKVARTDHERLLSLAYKRALGDATNPEDGSVDWTLVGEAMSNIMTSLYLAPSTTPKAGGLDFLGVEPSDVITETIKGYKLIVLGEEQ